LKIQPFLSLSFKLFLAATVLQAAMLTLLTWNSVRLMDDKLLERTEQRLQEEKQLLAAALRPLLERGDHARARVALDRLRANTGLTYFVLFDAAGRQIAASGWDGSVALPTPAAEITGDLAARRGRFDTSVMIDGDDRPLGELRFGVATTFLQVARDELIRDALLIGGFTLLVSVLLTATVAYLLTRRLERLTRAVDRMAEGNLDVTLPVESLDEAGRLTRAFNLMAQSLHARLAALQASEAKFHAIADYSYDTELWINPKGKLIWINPRAYDVFGYTPDECLLMDNFPVQFVEPEDAPRTVKQIRRALRGGTGQDYEFRAHRKDGSKLFAAADWRPIFDTKGEYLGIRISIRDVTQRREAEQRLAATVAELRNAQVVQRQYLEQARAEHARLSALLGAMDFGILFVGNDGRIVYSNPAFARVWGVPPGANLVGAKPAEALAQCEAVLARPEEQLPFVLALDVDGRVPARYEIRFADSRLLTQACHPVEDVFGQPVGHIWIYEDVTLERQTAEQLTYLAERDPLTGLFNRHRFSEELSRMLADAERNRARVALLFFDLDEFKYINDTFGHRAGDAMLIRVAGEVVGNVRRNEIFSRLGGDEFAILVPDVTDEMLRVLAERVVTSIARIHFQFEGQNLRLTTSLGIAVFPEQATNTEELIAHADTAMYQAKEAGKNAWRLYRADLNASNLMVARLKWNHRVAHALERDMMELHFQGVFAAEDLRLSHLEVLVRMRDPESAGTLLMPGQFIPHAEKSGRILDIDRWVIRKSIETLAAGPDVPSLAVNISGRSFDEPTLPKYIADLLRQHAVEPRRLLVELTETSAVSDLHDARRFIEALRQTGCHVCLDDFGTGFSSFAYLKHLEADAVKIDALFIRDLPATHDNQVFVRAIVSVARGLRKVTVAEGVEDRATLDMLREMGVDSVQGYLFGQPSPDLRKAARPA